MTKSEFYAHVKSLGILVNYKTTQYGYNVVETRKKDEELQDKDFLSIEWVTGGMTGGS